jgi:hypothetical protein
LYQRCFASARNEEELKYHLKESKEIKVHAFGYDWGSV